MPTRTKLRAGIKSILKLAAPIGAANLAIVCSGTIDTIMAGQTSAEDLAGVALGIAVATWISISLAGILQGVSPISGFAFGAKRFREVGDSLHQCLYLAVGLAVPGLVLTLQTKMWMAVARRPVWSQRSLPNTFFSPALHFRLFSAVELSLQSMPRFRDLQHPCL